MNSNTIKDMFLDWKEMEPGTWSKCGKILKYGSEDNDYIEIGLYREPIENEIYSERYTLQIFNGDDIIFCADIVDAK